MSCLSGHLLIASPHLADRNFFRSVVLIISHDDEHAFGLLLNRPGHESLCDVWHGLTGEQCSRDEMIRTGGPLDGPLMVIHQRAEFADTQIVPNVHLSTTQESVTPAIASGTEPLLPIVGYSGWGAGQLEVELEVGGWMKMRATEEIIFADPDKQWDLASRLVSDRILAGVNLRHVPQEARWN